MGDVPGDDYIVEVGGRRFRVSAEEIDDVRDRILRATCAGGGFVALGSGDARRDVLITPGPPVTIQRRAHTAAPSSGDAAGASAPQSMVATDDQFDDWDI
ncbi:hypothetical protein [Leifsonia shinshuensis]